MDERSFQKNGVSLSTSPNLSFKGKAELEEKLSQRKKNHEHFVESQSTRATKQCIKISP